MVGGACVREIGFRDRSPGPTSRAGSRRWQASVRARSILRVRSPVQYQAVERGDAVVELGASQFPASRLAWRKRRVVWSWRRDLKRLASSRRGGLDPGLRHTVATRRMSSASEKVGQDVDLVGAGGDQGGHGVFESGADERPCLVGVDGVHEPGPGRLECADPVGRDLDGAHLAAPDAREAPSAALVSIVAKLRAHHGEVRVRRVDQPRRAGPGPGCVEVLSDLDTVGAHYGHVRPRSEQGRLASPQPRELAAVGSGLGRVATVAERAQVRGRPRAPPARIAEEPVLVRDRERQPVVGLGTGLAALAAKFRRRRRRDLDIFAPAQRRSRLKVPDGPVPATSASPTVPSSYSRVAGSRVDSQALGDQVPAHALGVPVPAPDGLVSAPPASPALAVAHPVSERPDEVPVQTPADRIAVPRVEPDAQAHEQPASRAGPRVRVDRIANDGHVRAGSRARGGRP